MLNPLTVRKDDQVKRVLVTTYYWPPAGGGGVQRIAKFCKYLPKYGWEPVVLTVRKGTFPHHDPSLLCDIEHVRHVYRARTLEPHGLFKRISGRRTKGEKEPAIRAPSRKQQIMRTFGEYMRLNLFIPDSRIGWRRAAVGMGLDICDSEHIDLIFSTAPPYTPHLVAGALAHKTGLPWVADFRDPWLENLAYNTVPRLPPVRAINARMERRVLTQADKVVTVGPAIARLLQSKLDDSRRGKVSVIYNGYDREDIPQKITGTGEDTFRLAYFGTLYEDGFPADFLRAIRKLAEEEPSLYDDFQLDVTGKIPSATAARLQEQLVGLDVSFSAYKPHAEMLEKLYRPQVLLLVINDVPHRELIITGKIFDYLPSGNPILGIGPVDGDAANVLNESGRGAMFEPVDQAGIRIFLQKAYAAWREGRLNAGRTPCPTYERQQLTRELAQLFDEASNQASID